MASKIIESLKLLTDSVISFEKNCVEGLKANKKIMVQINRGNKRSKLVTKTNEYIDTINVPSTNTIIGGFFIFMSIFYYSLIMQSNRRFIGLN